jgi:Protein of unknown function (DUF3352)
MGTSEMMRTKLALVVVAASIALLAVACGGTSGAGTGASSIVPSNVVAFISIDTDMGSDQWKTIDALASKFPDKAKAVRAIRQSMRRDGGVDWETDVKPALGKETDLAFLDFANGGNDFVLLTQPHDEAAFKRFVAKTNASGGDHTVYEKVGDWEVVSESRSVIDKFKRESASAQRTLADVGDFNHAMDTLGSDRVVRAYVNGTQVMNFVRAQAKADPQIGPMIRKAGTLNWVAAGFGATSDGLHLDAIVHGTPGKLFKGYRAPQFTPQLTNSVPQDALLYLTFHGTPNLFGALKANPLLDTPDFRRFSPVLRQIGKLLAGEDALYLRAPPSGRIPEVTLVTEPARGTDGAATLDRLILRFRNQLQLTPTRTGALRTLDFGPVAVHYTNLNGKLVITTLESGLAALQNTTQPLAQSQTYRDAVDKSGMPGKTQGYLYVNVHSTIPAVERLSHAHIPGEIKRNLQPLRSALEYAVSRSHEVEVSFFLRLK